MRLLDEVREGSPEEVQGCIEETAPSQDESNYALLYAVCLERAELVRLMLKARADPNALYFDDREIEVSDRTLPTGSIPLGIAVTLYLPEIAAELLAAGADPNLRDIFGCTPLFISIDQEGTRKEELEPTETEFAVTKLLMDYGADPSLPCGEGRTHLSIAQHYRHAKAIAAIEAWFHGLRPVSRPQRPQRPEAYG